MKKIANCSKYEIEQNQNYNNYQCCNGGGYHQPLTIINCNGWRVEICNTSCGDFGTRVSTNLYHNDMLYDTSTYNTMDNIFNNFSKKYSSKIVEIIKSLDIPTVYLDDVECASTCNTLFRDCDVNI